MGIQFVETSFQNHSCENVWGGDFAYFFYLTYEMDQFVNPDLRGYRVFITIKLHGLQVILRNTMTAGSIKVYLEKTRDTDSFLEQLFVEPGDALEIKLNVN